MSEDLHARLRVPGRLDAHLDAQPGDVVAVVGPNGSGKTTMLRALAGLLDAEGQALLGGRDLLRLPPQQRQVGLVFQEQRLFPHLSALDNVAFGPRSRGAPRREADARAADWLQRFGLADLTARKPRELSGGQAQRVAIARALATDPRLLLMDEPFAGLDVAVAMTLRAELARHLSAYDGIALLVTHDPLETMTLANRVVVLDHGQVAQSGTPDDVAARPRTDHVAQLVGLNLVRERAQLGAFRPRDVVLSTAEPQGSGRHRWPGVVTSLTPHGDQVRVRVSGGQDLLVDLTPGAVTDLELVPGREVWSSVKQTAITWYPTGDPDQ